MNYIVEKIFKKIYRNLEIYTEYGTRQQPRRSAGTRNPSLTHKIYG